MSNADSAVETLRLVNADGYADHDLLAVCEVLEQGQAVDLDTFAIGSCLLSRRSRLVWAFSTRWR